MLQTVNMSIKYTTFSQWSHFKTEKIMHILEKKTVKNAKVYVDTHCTINNYVCIFAQIYRIGSFTVYTNI